MGRPPIGKVAMSSTERVHRFRAKHRPPKPETKSETKSAEIDPAAIRQRIDSAIGPLEARVRELEAELERERTRRGEGQLTRGRREERSRPVEFTEVGRLRAEIGKLKSDIIKLKAALQEEPDAAKLRKKVIDQQVEMASMRQVMKKIARERDEYRVRTEKRFREASHHATRKTYGVIVKALHSDRAKHATAAELAEAERLFIALKPLFEERQG